MIFTDLLPIFPKSRFEECIPFLESAFGYGDLSTPKRQIMFLAQAGHETQGFTRFEENLNYSAQGLANTWPYRYAMHPKAEPLVPNRLAQLIQRKPEKIANLTYANRMGNGPESSGDGYRFRGRGWFHNTGRAQYELRDHEFNMNGKIVANPDMLIQPYWGAMCAAAYWKERKLNEEADLKDVPGARKKIQGSYLHADRVAALYRKIQKVYGS